MGVRSTVLNQPNYLGWAPRERSEFAPSGSGADTAALYQPVVAARSADAPEPEPGPKKSLEEVVGKHLKALRQSYIQQGLEEMQGRVDAAGQFLDKRGGDYRSALRFFSMAESASLDAPEDRAYIKLLSVYAAIAAEEYATANNAIGWLAQADSRGRPKHAAAFNRIFDENDITSVGQLYANAQERELILREKTWVDPDYLRHNQTVEAVASQVKSSADVAAAAGPSALMAMVEWGRGRRSNAIFEAKRITAPTSRLYGLTAVLQEAEALRTRSWGKGSSLSQPAPVTTAQGVGTRPAF